MYSIQVQMLDNTLLKWFADLWMPMFRLYVDMSQIPRGFAPFAVSHVELSWNVSTNHSRSHRLSLITR